MLNNIKSNHDVLSTVCNDMGAIQVSSVHNSIHITNDPEILDSSCNLRNVIKMYFFLSNLTCNQKKSEKLVSKSYKSLDRVVACSSPVAWIYYATATAENARPVQLQLSFSCCLIMCGGFHNF